MDLGYQTNEELAGMAKAVSNYFKASEDKIILGADGFDGQALAKRNLPPGIYYFDSPSSNILFDENLDWCVRKTVINFMDILARVKQTGEYLVFPSSATVYNKNTTYARTKVVLEELATIYGVPALCLRITAGYGPGEAHKGRYASVVYQWCQQMKQGIRPVIYGDGNQTRDFIFEDDIADQIERLANEHATGVFDIGSGINTSFNVVVERINRALGTKIKPIYKELPKNYVPNTAVVPTFQPKVSLQEGIERILGGLDHGLPALSGDLHDSNKGDDPSSADVLRPVPQDLHNPEALAEGNSI